MGALLIIFAILSTSYYDCMLTTPQLWAQYQQHREVAAMNARIRANQTPRTDGTFEITTTKSLGVGGVPSSQDLMSKAVADGLKPEEADKIRRDAARQPKR